jgi:hypothetical protein
LSAIIAGADSIDDMDMVWHGAMVRPFGGVRAPSTLGTFLRGFRLGQVRHDVNRLRGSGHSTPPAVAGCTGAPTVLLTAAVNQPV